ncbi:MAG: M24 family metallopeptidase [Nitrososphaerales archaeon]
MAFDRKEITSRLLRLMHSNNTGALIAFSNGIATIADTDAIWSLTRYRAIGKTALIIAESGDEKLIVTPKWDLHRASACFDGSKIATDDFEAELKNELSRMIIQGNVAIAGKSSIDNLTEETIRSLAGTKNLIDGDIIVRELGKIRSEDELHSASRAAGIAEKGYHKLLECASTNMYEYELAAEVSSYMRSLGSGDVFQLLCASQHNLYLHHPTNRLLEENDIILAELSPSVDGIFMQACHTVVIGEVSAELQKNYDLLIRAFEDGLDEIKLGRTVGQVATTVNKRIEEAGYKEYCRPPYTRARGHGLGIGSILPGDITPENNTVLEEGMMFVLHPNQYLPETGYLLCGDTVKISGGHAVRLSETKLAIGSVSGEK